MSDLPPMAENNNSPSSLRRELQSAGLLYFLRVTGGLVGGYFLVVGLLAWGLGVSWSPLGQFGDTFGAISAVLNALALAAVVATVVLQSRELRESRTQLEAQAEAQRLWAAAAAKQIALTQRLESVRIRPFIKCEWLPLADSYESGYARAWELRMRNVGLGVAVVRAVRLQAPNSPEIHLITSHALGNGANETWNELMDRALKATSIMPFTHLALSQFDDLNRALASGEGQTLLTIRFGGMPGNFGAYIEGLRVGISVAVHFNAADGTEYSTDDQFKDVLPVD